MQRLFLFAAAWASATAQSAAPTGLLADYQRSPALGVRVAPALSWIVPPCDGAPDQAMVAYRIVVLREGAPFYDSGNVSGSDPTYVVYAGPPLIAGARFSWTVQTWSAACASGVSEPAQLVPGLPEGAWDAGAHFITLPESGATFGYFRKDIVVPAGTVSAVASLTGVLEDKLLSAYKLYIDGALINVGPGRGEAPVWGGDGAFRALPFTTLDVTAALPPGPHTLALQAMHAPPQVLMQLDLRAADGTATVLATDATWQAFNGDVHRMPGPAYFGRSAGNAYMEYIDARGEPVGWREPGFAPGPGWAPAVASPLTPADAAQLHAKMQPPFTVVDLALAELRAVPPPRPPTPTHPVQCGFADEQGVLPLACADGSVIVAVDFASFGTPGGACPDALTVGACNAATSRAVVEKACVGQTRCDVTATNSVFGGDPCYDTVKSLAVALRCPGSPPPPATNASAYVGIFPKEFQGGLRLSVKGGVAGNVVNISCGESLDGDVVGSTWGWQFWWTLRDGDQELEQHKYMECRFVSLVFSAAPASFELSAWWASYPFYEEDSAFMSDSPVLDAVWNLSRYTVHAASLDTYTDSNTRERTPYEADGMIAASGRLLVQRDVLFSRHSHAFVLQAPTWPVEWLQLTPFLAWQDFTATGRPDVALAFAERLHANTFVSYLDATGLLETKSMGRHIVDWMPDGHETDETVARGEFTDSNHTSVSNMLAAQGLDLLAQMLAAGGAAANASAIAAEAAALKAAIRRLMWRADLAQFCDGPCADVGGNSRVMTNMYSLALGFVTGANVSHVWANLTAWGLQQMGDYGAFWYQMAVASGYYAPMFDTPDDGSALVTALTKCDEYSWCSGLRDDNLTMTRESWHDGTYSHGWGTSPLVGVAWGVLGVHVTAPGWASVTVMPKLGPLRQAAGLVPSLRGFINVTATPGAVDVGVPCGIAATLCTPRAAADAHSGGLSLAAFYLAIDGARVAAVERAGHLCTAEPVGCGAAGATRQVRAHARN